MKSIVRLIKLTNGHTYAFSNDRVLCEEWCFEMYKEYESNNIRYPSHIDGQSWYLREMNMNCDYNDPECKKIVASSDESLGLPLISIDEKLRVNRPYNIEINIVWHMPFDGIVAWEIDLAHPENNTVCSVRYEMLPDYEHNQPILLDYDEDDLYPEDLGASGIVLPSPFKRFMQMDILNEDFVFFDYCKELDFVVIKRRQHTFVVRPLLIKADERWEKIGDTWYLIDMNDKRRTINIKEDE